MGYSIEQGMKVLLKIMLYIWVPIATIMIFTEGNSIINGIPLPGGCPGQYCYWWMPENYTYEGIRGILKLLLLGGSLVIPGWLILLHSVIGEMKSNTEVMEEEIERLEWLVHHFKNQ